MKAVGGTAPLAPSAIAEDYVKVVYGHTEWQPAPITTSGLALRLGLAASSVTEMVKKLSAGGLLTHVPYGAIELTERGRELALRMVRRHRLIETWLVEQHGYGWHEVHDEAEVLEHTISDRLLDSIDEQLGRPVRDPHGDPIPDANGVLHRPDAVLLGEAPDGHSGAVVRISDRDPDLLRYLAAEGIGLDTPVAVLGRRPFGGALAVRAADAELDLGEEIAASVWIAR